MRRRGQRCLTTPQAPPRLPRSAALCAPLHPGLCPRLTAGRTCPERSRKAELRRALDAAEGHERHRARAGAPELPDGATPACAFQHNRHRLRMSRMGMPACCRPLLAPSEVSQSDVHGQTQHVGPWTRNTVRCTFAPDCHAPNSHTAVAPRLRPARLTAVHAPKTSASASSHALVCPWPALSFP